MITRAIIEQKINEYQYRVRIPIFDKSASAPLSTNLKDLCIAVASMPKGVYNSLLEGDVVFVAFENNDIGSPVIIGQLYREALIKDQQNPLLNCRIIEVADKATLPTNTKIGAIDYSKLFYLNNVKDDLLTQMDRLESNLDSNESYLNNVKSDILILKDRVATETTLGNIKAGNGLSVSSDGIVSFSPTQKSYTVSYLDRDTINFCRGNRFECLPLENIKSSFIASRDFGDENWGEAKSIDITNNVFNTSNDSGFTVGDNSDNKKTLDTLYSINEYKEKEYKLTLEISMTGIYASLLKLYFWVSTNGAKYLKCFVYGKRGQDKDYSLEPLGSIYLGGWSGSNLLPLNITVSGSANESLHTSYYNSLKFVFESGPRSVYGDSSNPTYGEYPIIMKIAAYGIDAWGHLNNISHFDHMYSWDNDCNVTFPKGLKAESPDANSNDNNAVVTIGYLKSKGLI